MKLVLVLEEPKGFSPLLCYVYRNQQERVLAVADEIMEIEEMIEVSNNCFIYVKMFLMTVSVRHSLRSSCA